MARIGVIGAGSWGTALASLLCRNGQDVTLWAFLPEEAEELSVRRTNESKLPGFVIPENLSVTNNLEEACVGARALVVAVPSVAMRETAGRLSPMAGTGMRIFCATKGIEDETLSTMTKVLESEIPSARVAALSGPSHAEEVVLGMPTAVVCASADAWLAEWGQQLFMNERFRVYRSADVLGVELGAALKNVIALAAGMSDGLGYGDNTRAALITRGVSEMTQLAVKMGGLPATLGGLAGVGDLIVTCTSRHSRNHNTGALLGQGYTLEQALSQVHMVAEGVNSAKAVRSLGERYNVELPIIEAVCGVLFEERSPQDAVTALMTRAPREE